MNMGSWDMEGMCYFVCVCVCVCACTYVLVMYVFRHCSHGARMSMVGAHVLYVLCTHVCVYLRQSCHDHGQLGHGGYVLYVLCTHVCM
jgi:hypothetical protein